MKNLRYLFLLFTIIVICISCSKSDNPTEPIPEDNTWKETKYFDELSNPIIHFFNANEGVIAGGVYYGKAIFSTYFNTNWLFEDTIRILTPELTDTITSPKYPLWKTYDGGLTWKPIEGYFRTSIVDMKFVDESIGFVITDTEGVFKTTDGGESWFRIFGAQVMFISPGLRTGGVPTEIDFCDEKNGIIFLSSGPNGFVYLSTKDGGFNWDFIDSPYRMKNLRFPEHNNKTGYATNQNSFIKTEDGGQSWESIKEYSLSKKFAFMDIKNWVYSDGSKLYWTSDGGNTFEEVHDFQDPNLYSHFITEVGGIFFSNGLCCVEGFGGLRISSDSCRTFTIIPSKDLVFQDVSSPDGNIFYAVTNNGHFFKLVRKE